MTLRRVLIIDDDPDRHRWCHSRYAGITHEVVSAVRFTECIRLLDTEAWDVLHLDHDLADGRYNKELTQNPDVRVGATPSGIYGAPDSAYYDGRDIVEWLVLNPSKCPALVVIHSWADEAVVMEKVLRERLPNITVVREQAPV